MVETGLAAQVGGLGNEETLPDSENPRTAAPTILRLPPTNGDLGLDGLTLTYGERGHHIGNQGVQFWNGGTVPESVK